jgi:hypothetical protein
LQLCFEFELDSVSKVVYYLLFYRRAKSRKTISNIWVVFLIYNLVQFGKFKINCYRVGVTTVCPLRQSRSGHFQIPTPGPHVSQPEQGNLVCTTYSLVWHDASVRRKPKGPSQTFSLSSPIRGGSGQKYLPLSPFLPPHRGEHHRP